MHAWNESPHPEHRYRLPPHRQPVRLIGSHRFHHEYAVAASLIREQRIDVKPVITKTLPMEQIAEALTIARDRSTQMKVQLSFAD